MAADLNDRPPVRLPLVVQPQQRSESLLTDSLPRNVFIEAQPTGGAEIGKRPGFAYHSTADVGQGQGLYNWAGVYYSVAGYSLYKYTGGVWVSQGSIGSGTIPSRWFKATFNETQGSTPYLYIASPRRGYYFDGTTLTQIADLDYPALTVYGSAFLDGTLYVMGPDARIWGSDLNNPASWSATNVIRAQASPDLGVALAKQGIYVIAFKQWTTEVFYNAGAYAGTLTGSPLLPVQNAIQPWGCFAPYSVQSVNDELFWVGGNKSSTDPVVLHMVGLKLERISTAPVERLLKGVFPTTLQGYQFRLSGHTYYMLEGQFFNQPSAFTLVYDIEQKLWYVWSQDDGTGLGFIDAVGGIGNVDQLTLVQSCLAGNYYTPGSSTVVDAHFPGALLDVDSVPPQAVDAQIITPNFDAGTRVRKTLSRMRFIVDSQSAGFLRLWWSDDDYKTWSGATEVDLTLNDCFAANLGTFRRRAFKFQHRAPTKFRVEMVELDLLYGSL